ncbi:MAG TPA: glycosyl hydrolase family 79 C-terminal domain-containing protein [Solirubrobacteraceae bacterium]|nr:glycosyl hydrolase family 79 C-terminal domain-containing protein [Solirubrobacteraceae bacterium]
MGVPVKTPRALVALAVTALMLLLALAGCSSANAKHDSTTSTAASESGAVGASTGRPLPSGFLGLSMQYKTFEAYAGTDPSSVNPAFLNLIRDIAPNQSPILRFGGDSTDWTWWPVKGMHKPGGIRYTLNSRWLQIAHAMNQQLHSRLILGVNLEAAKVRLARTMANALVGGIGRKSIAGLEIGNEPELYAAFNWYTKKNGTGVRGRNKATWTESAFFKQFHQFGSAMPSGVPLAGPASGSATYLAKLGAFLSGEPRVKLATFHAYPLKHCTPHVVTISQLLSAASTSGFARAQAQYVNAAHHRGRRAQLDEMNGITCGGYRGVSNTFASALWVLDVLFELDRIGVDGVNMQTVPGGVQEIFGPVAGDGGSMVVHPEFYGMMMFAQAAPAGSRLFTIHTRLPSNVKLWATRASDRSVRVTLINDNSSKPRTVHVPLSSPGGPAAVEKLRAPHIGSTGGVTLGGRSFGSATSTGLLPAPMLQQLKSRHGGYTVRVPPATAILLTVPASAAQSSSTTG